jgi:hypothetical protein
VNLEQHMTNLENKKDEVIGNNLRIYEASKQAFDERLVMSHEVARLQRELEAAKTQNEYMQAIHWGPNSAYWQTYVMKQQQDNDDRQEKEYARQDLIHHTRQQQTDYSRYLQAYQNNQVYKAYQWQAQVQAYQHTQLQAQQLNNTRTPPPVPRREPYAGWDQQDGVLDSPVAVYHSRQKNSKPPYREEEMYMVKAIERSPTRGKIIYPSAGQSALAKEQYLSPQITYGDLSETNSLHTQTSRPSTPPPTVLNPFPDSHGEEENDPGHVLSPKSVSSVSTVRPKRTNTKEYARHIDEAIAREQIAIVRAEKMDERLNGDLEEILEEVEALRGLKDRLCGMLNNIGNEMNQGRIEG